MNINEQTLSRNLKGVYKYVFMYCSNAVGTTTYSVILCTHMYCLE